jgi:hypothetical protein
MNYKYHKDLYLLWASPPWVVLVLRIAASPTFLYACSEAVTAAHVSLDAFTYLALVLPTFPWGAMLSNKSNPTLQQKTQPTFTLNVCLVISLVLTVAALVVQLLTRFSVIQDGCDDCPSEGGADVHLQCGAVGDDFFYNALNFCTNAVVQQCEYHQTAELPDISHCPLYGCSMKLLPLQSTLFWLQVATLGVNIIVLGLMLNAPEHTLQNWRLPGVAGADSAASNANGTAADTGGTAVNNGAADTGGTAVTGGAANAGTGGSGGLVGRLPRLSLSPLQRPRERSLRQRGYAPLRNVHDI